MIAKGHTGCLLQFAAAKAFCQSDTNLEQSWLLHLSQPERCAEQAILKWDLLAMMQMSEGVYGCEDGQTGGRFG